MPALLPVTLTPLEWELPYRPLWPIAATLIDREPGVVFLDSGGDPTGHARWSILAWRPRRLLSWPQGAPGALDALRHHLATRRLARPTSAPPQQWQIPFHGGWLGWFAYDLGRHIERLPARARADPAIPDFVLGEYDVALVEDRREGRLFAAGSAASARHACRLRDRLDAVLQRPCPDGPPLPTNGAIASPPRPALDKRRYLDAVERVLRYIVAGDIYQANFAHRFDARYTGASADLYARLRAASPAPCGGFFALPGAPELLSISPELFLAKRGDRVETQPIKGTRPRAADPGQDAAQLDALEQSEKERAELLMIVDLLRNDLGRVARVGSVAVEELRRLTSHPTVHHASATVSACLPADIHAVDLLTATFPGGSISGAPKIRAMEVLEELEPVRRGPYSGAAGFIGYDGDLRLSLLIRTLVRQGSNVSYHVGGGIVADSDPEAEYQETLDKGAAMMRALMGPGAGP